MLLPQDKALPMQIMGEYGLETRFESWEDVKKFILDNKDFCLDPQRKQGFASVLTNNTCSPAARDLIESIVSSIDFLSTKRQQQDLAINESKESHNDILSISEGHSTPSPYSDDESFFNVSLPEGHSTPLSYSDDEDDMEEHPSSTNNPTQNNEVANEILGAILKKVYTQAERKQQLKGFVKKIHVIMKFYTMFALLPIRQQQQKQQQIEHAKKQLIAGFQEWVSNTIHKTITTDMALSILARLVQMARKKQD